MKLTSAVRKKSQVSKSVQQNLLAVRILYTGSDLLYGFCTLAKNGFYLKTITYVKAKYPPSVQFLYSLIVSHTYRFYLLRNTALNGGKTRGKHRAAEKRELVNQSVNLVNRLVNNSIGAIKHRFLLIALTPLSRVLTRP